MRLRCHCGWDYTSRHGEEMSKILEDATLHFGLNHGKNHSSAMNCARKLIEETMSPIMPVNFIEEQRYYDSRYATKVLGNFPDEEMDINTMNAKVVMVRFDDNSKPYNFFTEFEHTDGEKIVVRCATGLAVVTVIGETKASSAGSKANAWVISKIDFSGEEKRTKKAKLEKELKAAIEATSVLERAKQLASLNPELAAMIAELEELG